MRKLLVLLALSVLTAETTTAQTLAVVSPQGKYTISGTVTDASTGEELIDATIYIRQTANGTVTNSYGFYSITLPAGDYDLMINFLGYSPLEKHVGLTQNLKLNFVLEPENTQLAQVDVKGEKLNRNLTSADMGMEKLQIKTIKQIPALFGETDVIKSIQFLPGVGSSGEGFIGYNVRGGGTGQNLMLLDEATVYNAAHLGGFFSVFNNDALKDVQFYKGGIPAEFGGRLSSLLDVRMKEGNTHKIGVEGGIGLLSSRLTIDGPIKDDRCTFLLSGRRSYMDLFFPLYKDMPDNTTMYFYDMNAKINYRINDNNRVFASGYFGRDVMKFVDEYIMEYGNRTLTTRYNHLFSDRLFSNLSLIYSHFDYVMGMSGTKWVSAIRDWSAKGDLTFFANPHNTVKGGMLFTYHKFSPFIIETSDKSPSYVKPEEHHNRSFEYGAYLSDNAKIGERLTLDFGLRFSALQNRGADDQVVLDENYEIVDSIHHGKGTYNTYSGFEPRLSVNFRVSESSSIKANYQQTYQYVHLASTTMSPLPIDTWFSSNPNIKPEKCRMASVGYFQNFLDNEYAFSGEAYYKRMYNLADFKDHADVMVSNDIERQLRIGNGYSYGFEFQLKKQEARFTGWLSYTYSRTYSKIEGINDNKYYPSNYDKPHDLSVVASYDVLPRLHLSLNWVYSTGVPRTMPTGRFEYGGVVAPIYTERNALRLPDFHRLDFSATFDFKPKERNGKPWLEHNLNLSIYNLYNRHNASSIMFEQDENDPSIVRAEKLYMFGLFPSVTYNFKF